jgi:uncharacterized protein (DUF1800 family)
MAASLDTTAAVRRLLHRTGFAAGPDEVAAAARAGFGTTLERVLHPDPAASQATPPTFPALTKPKKSDTAAKKDYRHKVAAQSAELVLWWLDRMVSSPEPWVEKRTLRWHGHWATSIVKVKSAAAMAAQNQTERRLGGGDFAGFARAMVKDPALMIWLDASGNTPTAPNENLGRELMELFTLGFGNYQENDVRQAALALTGWRVDRKAAAPTAQFDPSRHARGTETILGKTAAFDADSLVDLLVSQPASPRYLATRLWGWLVSPTPPSPASLDRLVKEYGPGRSTTALFAAMLSDPAFVDPASVLVKQPIDYLVGALRALQIRPAKLPDKGKRALAAGLRGLGQVPFRPPSVGGWPTNGAWLTTSAADARFDLATALAKAADLGAISALKTTARADHLAEILGVGAWTARTRSVLAGTSDPAAAVALALCAPEYVVSR